MTPLPQPEMSTTHLDPPPVETMPNRRTRLLASAARAFTASGFKAASLRDIAADAGVSLTLVDHHFGSKEQLLLAVVARHHDACKQRMAGFRTALQRAHQPPSLAGVATAWVQHEFELYASDAGREYLLFLIKLMADQTVGSGIRQTLDCSEPVVVHALAQVAPRATAAERRRAFIVARGALHAAMLDCAMAMEAGVGEEVTTAIAFCTSFVMAGLGATLHA